MLSAATGGHFQEEDSMSMATRGGMVSEGSRGVVGRGIGMVVQLTNLQHLSRKTLMFVFKFKALADCNLAIMSG